MVGVQPLRFRCTLRHLHSGIVAHCINVCDALFRWVVFTYSDAMPRIIVTAPQLMSVVNEELPGHEIVGGDHFMDRQELADQIVIGQCAAGFNNIDLDAARQAGVVVTSTPGVLHEATADLAFTLLLEVTRRTGEAERWVRAGKAWRYDHTFMLGAGLQGATLGIIGLGQIGEAMARRAAAFGMNVIYNARHEKDVAAIDAVNPSTQPTRRVELDELLATSDAVSLHCPLTDQTRHVIDADALATMKETACLVNTARGACVDEAALVQALKAGSIAGAGLDVFEDEPTITGDLMTMENVVLLPHIGSAALPTREVMSRLAARNIAKVLSGEPAETPVE